MANDASNHPQNANDADMTVSGDHNAEFDAVQLAQADTTQQQPQKTAAAIPAVPNGTVNVVIPQGENVVRVAVANGETVVLPAPFDDAGDLAAKRGDGNLAIKVGDITVILIGYENTLDDNAHPVVVKDAQGDTIDLAVVVAGTDPNLSIITAAGGDAVGAQGADNTGALLSQFGLGAGLGGLNAVGVLDQTELRYKLIDNSILQERADELNPGTHTPGLIIGGAPAPALNQAFLQDPIVTLAQYQGHLDFASFINGFENVPAWSNHFADFDGTKAGQGDEHVTGTITVDPQLATTVHIELNTQGLEAQGLTSNGVALHYELSADGTTIFGFRGDGTNPSAGNDGALVLVVHVNETPTGTNGTEQTFTVDYYLANRIDDALGGTGTHLNLNFDVTTGADQTGHGTTGVDYLDDAPISADDTANVGNLSGITVTAANGVEKNDLFGADGKIDGKGGVIGVEAGAHKADTVTTGVDTDIQGQFGKLHLNADGSYTYTRDNPDITDGKAVVGSDQFTYTIKDDDGDTSTAVLTININDNPVIITPPPPPHDGDNPIDLNKSGTAVFESGLPDGSKSADNTETTSGSVKVTAKDGVGTVTVDGTTIKLDGTPTTIAGKYGDITVTWDKANNEIDYTYTLKDNDPNHSKQGNDVIPGEDFKVVVTDTDGDKSSGDINISIVDDVPTANDDAVSLKSGQTSYTSTLATNVEGNDVFGADGKDSKGGVVGVHAGNDDANGTTGVDTDIHGTYGTLHLKADGSYTYTRDNNDPITGTIQDKFTYTVKDGDGDLDSAVLTINLSDNPVIITPPPPPHDGDNPLDLNAKGTAVFEKGLTTGSGELADGDANNNSDKSEATSGSVKVTALDGVGAITIDNQTVKLDGSTTTINGTYGTMTAKWDAANNEIDYTYVLTKNDPNHPAQGTDMIPGEDFKVVVTDTDGDKDQGDINISIVDDVPTAKDDTVSLASGQSKYTSGLNVESNDVFGADGKAAGGGVVGVHAGSDDKNGTTGVATDIHGTYGTLHLNADGTFTYTRDNNDPITGTIQDKFTYTVKDGDGDLDSAVLTINLSDNPVIVTPPPPPHDGDNPIDLNKIGTAVFESALSTGSNPASNAENTTGSVKVTALDGVNTITIDGQTVKLDGSDTKITGKFGDIVAHWDAANKEIDYTYTLTKADPNHSAQGNDIIPGEDFKVVVTDTDGDKGQGDINISIVDDVPTAKDDVDTVNSPVGSKTSGNVVTGAGDADSHLVKDVSGADGATVVGVHAGGDDKDGTGGVGTDIQGTYGILHLNADGTYTYTVTKAMESGQTDKFTYTVKDGDGDTSSAVITIDANCIPDIKHINPFTDKGEVTVSESGLAGGTHDAPSNTGADGSFKVDSHNEGFQNVQVEGVTIITGTGPVAIPAGGIVIPTDSHGTMTITSIQDDGKGSYTVSYHYTLSDNIDGVDANNGHNTDTTTLPTINIDVKDKSGDEAHSTIEINVVDDIAKATDGTKMMGTDVQKNNVCLVIDTTGSMDVPYPNGDSSTNKLQFEVQACMNLLNAYLAAGGNDPANLRVQIVTFAVEGTNQTTQWVDITTAINILTQISQLNPNGNTNYDAAVQHVLDGVDWTTGGQIPDGTNSLYFFSDGLPNQATPGDNNPGLNGTQLTQWLAYLNTHDVNAYAIGMGAPNGSAEDAALDIVAYNGQGAGTDTQSFNATDPSQLSDMIIATIGTNSGGNLVGDLGGTYGADGPGNVNSITLDGKTYTLNAGANTIAVTGAGSDTSSYNAATHTLTITTANGVLDVNMLTGAYTYHQNGGSHANVVLGYTLIDGDGDVSNGGHLYLLSPLPIVTKAADPSSPALLAVPTAPAEADFDAAHTFKSAGGDGGNLTGTAQADFIDAGPGKDTMTGLGGNDVYVVNQTNDKVVEASNAGIDTVLASDDYTLAPNVENLFLQGSNGISGHGNELDNVIVGNSGGNFIEGLVGNDKLFGGDGTDNLQGGAGNDYLDGGAGNDQMAGGAGNDVYVVSDSKDTVTEAFNQGTDHVLASVSHTLGANVENLTLTGSGNINGTGNELDNTIVGNSGDNHLVGNSGNDILVGGAGADQMDGSAGNDQFLKVDAADLSGTGSVNGGDGDDLVDLSQLASFNSGQAAHITNVEVLSFNGGAGTAITLDVNAVLTMTDANNNLVIHGDQNSDTVALSGGFSKIGTDITANDGQHYDVFQAGTGANTVTVFVDHNLNATAN